MGEVAWFCLVGAVLADVMKDKAEEFWMTKAEYEEKGKSVLSKLGPTRES